MSRHGPPRDTRASATGCPEAETLAAFVDGTLEDAAMREVEAHLLTCEDCSTVAVDAADFNESATQRRATSGPRRVLWVSGSLAAGVLTALVLWRFAGPGSGRTAGSPLRGIAPLLSAASGEDRTIEARLSGFAWKTLEPRERTAGARPAASLQMLSAAAEVEKEAASHPTAENLHAFGVAHLLLGDLDDAVASLKRAQREDPASAGIAADLGAALLERGDRGGRPEDLLEALSAIEKGLESDTKRAELLFNHAIALEKLHLDQRAIEAWETYLKSADDPAWADEARRRLERLRSVSDAGAWERERQALNRESPTEVAALVKRWPQEARTWLEVEVLTDWANSAASKHETEARDGIHFAEMLAGALQEVTGDRMPTAAVSAVRETLSNGDAGRLSLLIGGHRDYGRAMEAMQKLAVNDGAALFAHAEESLNRAHSPFAVRATIGAVRCAYYQHRFADADRSLAPVMRGAEQSGYLAAAAQAHQLRGLLAEVESRLGDSLVEYRRSLSIYERLRETENIGFLWASLADTYQSIGDTDDALQASLESVARVRAVHDPGRAILMVTSAAQTIDLLGLPEIAYRFQDLSVEWAANRGDAIDGAESFLHRARLAIDLEWNEKAREDLEEAFRKSALIVDADVRARVEAEVDLSRARLARQMHNPDAARQRATEALTFFSRAGMEFRLPELYLERGRAELEARRDPEAERDFLNGIEQFEQHRSEVLSQSHRISYFDSASNLFDEMVGLQTAHGHTDLALEYLERGKTRELEQSWANRPDLSSARFRQSVPEGTALIVYGVLHDRLLTWVIGRDGREFEERPVLQSDLDTWVHGFRNSLLGADATDASDDAGSKLQATVLSAARPRLQRARVLIFIPDKVLHAVPFAALRDPETGRRLIEDHAVVVSPSVSLYLHALTAPRGSLALVDPKLVVIGDPAFDSAIYPQLPRLGEAAVEAKRIATLYRDPLLLTGAEATRSRVLAALQDADVLHIAAHAMDGGSDPLRARLILAPSPDLGDSGTLFADEIYKTRLDRTRLVVLAGCGTAMGRISRGEGPLSLARPFLAAGVPAVLATSWEIEDAPSAEILVRFHREITSGRTPEEALREAQLFAINSSDPALSAPRAWAAFQVLGAPTPLISTSHREG